MTLPGTYERCLAGGHYYAVVRGDEECPVCAQITTLRAELATAQRENICDVCAGTGKPENCMCGGTGRQSDAVSHLRPALLKAEQDLATAKQRIAELEADWWAAMEDQARLVHIAEEATELWFGDVSIEVETVEQLRIAIDATHAGKAEVLRAVSITRKGKNEQQT